MEEQVGGFGFEGDVSDFVDDEKGDPAQAGELCLELPCGGGVSDLGGGVRFLA